MILFKKSKYYELTNHLGNIRAVVPHNNKTAAPP
jgi:hypothetical protein